MVCFLKIKPIFEKINRKGNTKFLSLRISENAILRVVQSLPKVSNGC